MRKTLFLLAFFIFWGNKNNLFSQAKLNVDSLKALLNKYPKADTSRAKLLIHLSHALVRLKPKEGIIYSEQALAIAENFNYPELKADALFAMAQHVKDQYKRKESLDWAKQALEIYERLHRSRKMAETHHLIGRIYDNRGDLNNGKVHFEQALTLSEQLGDMKIKAEVLNGLGVIYIGKDDNLAVSYNEQSVNLAHKIRDQKGEALALNSLGLCQYRLGNYTKAIDYLQRAVRLHETVGNDYSKAYAYEYLGFVYGKLVDHSKALDYYNKSLEIAQKMENENIQGSLYNLIGNCYKVMKKYNEAIDIIEKGIEYNKKTGTYLSLWFLGSAYEAAGRDIEAYRYYQDALTNAKKSNKQAEATKNLISLGQLLVKTADSSLLRMGLKPNERYSKAEIYANEALEIGRKMDAKQIICDALKLLSKVYEQKEAYIDAYKAYKEYTILNDSLKGDEVKKEVTRKEIQYEFDKKETELKYQQQLTADELEKQRLLTVQQEQTLTLKEQALALSNKDLLLSNKEKDLAHLAYLKEQAEKQEKAQQLSLSQEREKGAARDLSLKNLELSAQQKQNLYLGLFSILLLGGLSTLLYFYNTLKKQKNIITQQNELNEHTIAILSHDIKEPLLGVKLMLKKINKDDPFVVQASQSLENQINNVNSILTNLLKMKKIALTKKDKNTSANVNTVVQNVLQELSVAIQTKDLQIQNELNSDLILPIASEKLQIIIHNLLSNAVKYSFPNSIIRIFPEGKGFSIQDFGVGLSPEQRSKIMREVTASQQGTNQERGNGLGLFLVGAMLQGEQLNVVFDSPEVGGTIAKVLA